jgi:pseudouridine kinase
MLPIALVIGTVFMDCKGFSKQLYNPVGRNVGNVKFVHGGVGRNVAENMANLRIGTMFVSSVDKTGIGKEVVHRLDRAGINVDYLLETEARGMGIWLAIMDETGELAGSVSQMPDLAALENFIAESGPEIIRRSSHVIIELDLNEFITKKVMELARENARPVYGIPGNLGVILKDINMLSGLDCFIYNDIEAGRLMGRELRDSDPGKLQQELTKFVDTIGLASMVITLGSAGCVYYDARNGEKGFQPIFPVTVIDTSGAGDAFFSGTVMGLIRNKPLGEAVVYGTKVASWTIQSDENTCRDLADKMAVDEVFNKLMDDIAKKGFNRKSK